MAIVNARESVPDAGDVVTSVVYSRDRMMCWVKFASGKTFAGRVDTMTRDERAADSTGPQGTSCCELNGTDFGPPKDMEFSHPKEK